MGDKATLADRVRNLRIDVEALDKVSVPEIGVEIPNAEGKLSSLRIYAAITNPEGFISLDEAKRGLSVFGDEYIAETMSNPGKHPNIEGLIKIVEGRKAVRSDVYRRESVKMHPFTDDDLFAANRMFGTPIILYDEATIWAKMEMLNSAFSWVPGGFKNHIAVKATDCAPIISIAYKNGMGVDCASAKELHMSDALGITGENIILTSNATPASLFTQARDMGAIINFDDATHIDYFRRNVGALPKTVCLRYNPGSEMMGGDRIIGEPGRQKYGMPRNQVVDAVRFLHKLGVKNIGLQTMLVSNELREENLIGNASILFDLANHVTSETGIPVDFADVGGGLGIKYRPEQIDIDMKKYSEGIRAVFEEKLKGTKNERIQLKMESGRWITGDSAVLLMNALHLEQKPGGNYIKVDASGNDFARVEVYGCYQHLVVPGKTEDLQIYNVAGPKCENSDHFARNRLLPRVQQGDLLALCGAGAHGHMMGPGYNGFPKCAEVMKSTHGFFEMLTRAESLSDQFAKYDFKGSKFVKLAQIGQI